MFGLTELGTPRASRAGKSKGVVLVRGPRRVSWLAGWTPVHPGGAPPRPPGRTAAPAVVPGSPVKPRNRP